jgi:hypothetical protein
VTINPHAKPDPMSYENNDCPCGGRKDRETMLCQPCEQHVAGSFDRREMDNQAATLGQRRAAAIRVLAAVRTRGQLWKPTS